MEKKRKAQAHFPKPSPWPRKERNQPRIERRGQRKFPYILPSPFLPIGDGREKKKKPGREKKKKGNNIEPLKQKSRGRENLHREDGQGREKGKLDDHRNFLHLVSFQHHGGKRKGEKNSQIRGKEREKRLRFKKQNLLTVPISSGVEKRKKEYRGREGKKAMASLRSFLNPQASPQEKVIRLRGEGGVEER